MRWAIPLGLLGVGAGWLGASFLLAAPAPTEDLPRAQAQGGPVLASPSCPDDSELVSQLAALQAEVEAVRAAALVTDGQLAAEIGTPQLWSEQIPEAFHEEAIEAHLAALVSQVEGASLEGMDCAEYPCVAALHFTDQATFDAFRKLNEASPYQKASGASGVTFDPETDEVLRMSWVIAFHAGIPQDKEDAARKRWAFRVEDLTESLRD